MNHLSIVLKIERASRARDVDSLLMKHADLEASTAECREVRDAAVVALSRINAAGFGKPRELTDDVPDLQRPEPLAPSGAQRFREMVDDLSQPRLATGRRRPAGSPAA